MKLAHLLVPTLTSASQESRAVSTLYNLNRGPSTAETLALLRRMFSTFARSDNSIPPPSAKLTVEIMQPSHFDDGEEGRWHRDAEDHDVKPDDLDANEFVQTAMRAIP